MFDNHRDIVNAMFEVYYEIGEDYLKKYYDPLEGTKIKIEAQERVEKKYGRMVSSCWIIFSRDASSGLTTISFEVFG